MVAEWELEEVDVFVNRVANSPVKHFYPTAAAKYTGLPLHLVFERLLKLVDSKKIILKWEVRCPSYSCGRTVDTTDNLDHKVGIELQCVCGEQFEISPDIIFPIFELNPEYKEHIKKKGSSRTLALRERRVSSPGTPVSLKSKDLISEPVKDQLKKHLPAQIINHITVHGSFHGNVQGDAIMTDNSRSISDSFNGGNFGDNVNVQGDHVKQSKTVNQGVSEQLLAQLISDIQQKVADEDKREQALLYAEQLKEALEAKDKDKANKFLGWIRGIVQDSSALVTLGTFIAGL